MAKKGLTYNIVCAKLIRGREVNRHDRRREAKAPDAHQQRGKGPAHSKDV